jgi:hypothetical protein
MASRHIIFKIELTPLGKSLLRLAQTIADADPVLLSDEVIQAAQDVLALAEEHRDG